MTNLDSWEGLWAGGCYWDTGLSLEQRGPRDSEGHGSSLQGRITELGFILQKLSREVKRSQDIHHPSHYLAWKHH